MVCSGLLLLLPSPTLAGPTVDRSAEPSTSASPDRPGAEQPIVGGSPAGPDDFPAVVALYTRNDTFGCTGTLIAPDLVLTAGHCGFSMAGVVAGTHDLTAGGSRHGIAEVWVHPDYASTFDVAVYRLETPVEGVEPVPLLLDCHARDALTEGASSWIVGFGDIDAYATESTEVLHAAEALIRDPYCIDPANACNPAVSPGGELIAGGDGIDSCNGDSGGPLFVEYAGQLHLAGVTSRQAQPSTVPCGDGGIYPRADAFAAWVEASTGLPLEWPDCPDEPPPNLPPVARVDPLTVIQNGRAEAAWVEIVDDPTQSHTVRLLGPPPSGRAWVDGTTVFVQPDPFSDDDFVLELEVTDDGEPPASTRVELPVEVLGITVIMPERGCTTCPSASTWSLLSRRRPITPPRPPR